MSTCTCQDSLAEQAQQLAAIKQKELNDALETANKKISDALSEIPTKIEEITTLIAKIVAGIDLPKSPDFDPDACLAALESALNGLLGALDPLLAVVPKIPGLDELKELIALISSMPKEANPDGFDARGMLPSISMDFKSTLDRLIVVINTIMT